MCASFAPVLRSLALFQLFHSVQHVRPSLCSASLLPLSVCLFVRLQLIFIKFANGKFILLQLRRLLLLRFSSCSCSPLLLLLLVVVAVGGRSAYRENFYLNDFQIMLVLLLLQPRLHASPARCFLFICATFTDFLRFYIFVYVFYGCVCVCGCLYVWVCCIWHFPCSFSTFPQS